MNHETKWAAASRLTGECEASRYLKNLMVWTDPFTSQIRFIASDFGKPVLIVQYVAPDASAFAYQLIDITTNDIRMLPGRVPKGGSVRLCNSAETMAVTPSVTTALAITKDDPSLPCWATLTYSNLLRWQPPERAKHILIYCDPSEGFSNELAAYSLAYRLSNEGKLVEVRQRLYDTWYNEITAKFADDMMLNLECSAKKVFGNGSHIEQLQAGA